MFIKHLTFVGTVQITVSKLILKVLPHSKDKLPDAYSG